MFHRGWKQLECLQNNYYEITDRCCWLKLTSGFIYGLRPLTSMNVKKVLIVFAVGFALYGIIEKNSVSIQSHVQQNTSGDEQISSAFQNHQSNIQVGGSGVVIRNLPDDTKGSQHQKFILKLPSGHTLLIVHNIDLAPRINSLREGDKVGFYGEYEWNQKGGVVHWTHNDPDGHHETGWLKHEGNTYQ